MIKIKMKNSEVVRKFKDIQEFKKILVANFVPTYTELLDKNIYNDIESINNLLNGTTKDNILQFEEVK